LFALYFVGIIKRESAAIIFARMFDSATAKGVATSPIEANRYDCPDPGSRPACFRPAT
jgi:hypothetical protein